MIGIKTGTTTPARGNLVFAANKNVERRDPDDRRRRDEPGRRHGQVLGQTSTLVRSNSQKLIDRPPRRALTTATS